jgi:adenine phosphoribosyltransferase
MVRPRTLWDCAGTDKIAIQADALRAGDRVAIVDDLLATGGTAEALVRLIQHVGATPLAAVFPIELSGLNGRRKLHAAAPGMVVDALVSFE